MKTKTGKIVIILLFVTIVVILLFVFAFKQDSVKTTYAVFNQDTVIINYGVMRENINEYLISNNVQYDYGTSNLNEKIEFRASLYTHSVDKQTFYLDIWCYIKDYILINSFIINIDGSEIIEKVIENPLRSSWLNGLVLERKDLLLTKNEFFKISKAKKLTLILTGENDRVTFNDVKLPMQIKALLSAADIKE